MASPSFDPPEEEYSSEDNFPQTQFKPKPADEESLWEVKSILDEYVPPPKFSSSAPQKRTNQRGKGYFLVDWAGVDPATRKPYTPTWEEKTSCTDALILEWKEKKSKDSGLMGRWLRTHPNGVRPPDYKKSQSDGTESSKKRTQPAKKKLGETDRSGSEPNGVHNNARAGPSSKKRKRDPISSSRVDEDEDVNENDQEDHDDTRGEEGEPGGDEDDEVVPSSEAEEEESFRPKKLRKMRKTSVRGGKLTLRAQYTGSPSTAPSSIRSPRSQITPNSSRRRTRHTIRSRSRSRTTSPRNPTAEASAHSEDEPSDEMEEEEDGLAIKGKGKGKQLMERRGRLRSEAGKAEENERKDGFGYKLRNRNGRSGKSAHKPEYAIDLDDDEEEQNEQGEENFQVDQNGNEEMPIDLDETDAQDEDEEDKQPGPSTNTRSKVGTPSKEGGQPATSSARKQIMARLRNSHRKQPLKKKVTRFALDEEEEDLQAEVDSQEIVPDSEAEEAEQEEAPPSPPQVEPGVAELQAESLSEQPSDGNMQLDEAEEEAPTHDLAQPDPAEGDDMAMMDFMEAANAADAADSQVHLDAVLEQEHLGTDSMEPSEPESNDRPKLRTRARARSDKVITSSSEEMAGQDAQESSQMEDDALDEEEVPASNAVLDDAARDGQTPEADIALIEDKDADMAVDALEEQGTDESGGRAVVADEESFQARQPDSQAIAKHTSVALLMEHFVGELDSFAESGPGAGGGKDLQPIVEEEDNVDEGEEDQPVAGPSRRMQVSVEVPTGPDETNADFPVPQSSEPDYQASADIEPSTSTGPSGPAPSVTPRAELIASSKPLVPVPMLSPSVFRSPHGDADGVAHPSQAETIDDFDSPAKSRLLGRQSQGDSDEPDLAEGREAMDLEPTSAAEMQTAGGNDGAVSGSEGRAVADASDVELAVSIAMEVAALQPLASTVSEAGEPSEEASEIKAIAQAQVTDDQKTIISLEAQIADLTVKLQTTSENLDWQRALYDQASTQAMIHASKTRELSSEVKKLRSQLLLGMQQQKLVYEGESKARLAEIRTLQGQLKVLHDQNRLTNDDIREKARKYPELEFEIEARMFDFTEERDRRRKLQRKYRALKEKVRAVGIDAGSSRLLGSQDSDAGEHNQANLLSMAELGYMTNNRPRPASRSSVSSGDESSSSEEEFATESGDGEGKEREPAGTLRASFIPDSDQESDDDEDEEEQASGQENSMEGKIMDPVQANAIVPGQADPDVMLCKWGADEAGGPCGLVATSQEEMEDHLAEHIVGP